jgi:iron(III) transport system permease protein
VSSRVAKSDRWPRAGSAATLPAFLSSGLVWQNVVLLTVAVFVILPLAFLVIGSFSTASLPTDFSFAKLSLSNYADVWFARSTYALFHNTAIYVGGATAFGIGCAAILAWLVERTNLPGKIWLYAGVPMTLAVPGLIQAMAWVLLLSPRAGFVNRWLMDGFGLESAPFNIYTLAGMSFVEGLRLVPTAFLMLVPLLRSLDPALEEAASISGSPPLSSLRRITLGLMVPGLVAVVIYQAMTALEVFEVPGILGMPSGLHVFATKVYTLMESTDRMPSFGQANALSILYLAIGLGAALVYWNLIRKSERYTVVTGKGYRPRLIELGSWRYPALALVALFLLLAVGLPFLVMLYSSFVGSLQQPSWEAFRTMSLINYDDVFSYPRFAHTFWNTILMVVGTATATTLASFVISLVIVRGRFWGRRLLDQLAFVPHTIPGIVAGLAFMWLFLKLDLFGSILSIVIAFSVIFIAYGTRSMNAAILQIHSDLKDAADIAGAPPWRTMLHVFFPLMLPTFVGLWIWVALLAVRIVGLPLILYQGPENEVLAVLMWNLWDEGRIEAVAAVAVLLMVGLFVLILALRMVGFARGTMAR